MAQDDSFFAGSFHDVPSLAVDPSTSKQQRVKDENDICKASMADLQEIVSNLPRIKLSTYIYIIMNNGQVRFMRPADEELSEKYAEVGHTSLLPEEEYNKAYDEKQKVVKYAGWFKAANRKIIKWDNNSGHFKPHAMYSGIIAKEIGFGNDVEFIDSSPEHV